MIKKTLIFLVILLMNTMTVSAQDGYVLKAGISKINAVPKQFFGTWTVESIQVSTDSPKTFSQGSVDLWNLRRSGNVIELRNPITSAVAEIYLDEVNENEIVFTHYEKDGNTELKDTVKLQLKGDTFTGSNELILKKTTYDEYHMRKVTETKSAIYSITGKKISGTGIK